MNIFVLIKICAFMAFSCSRKKGVVTIKINFLFNKKNIVWNIEKYNRDNNILYVTGLSGSGKTTISNSLANKFGAQLFELDHLEGFFGKYKNDNSIIHSLTEKFLNKNLELKTIIKKGNYFDLKINNFQEYVKWTQKYIRYLEEYALSNKNLFILEGTQLFKCVDTKHFYNKPFIIVRTSSIWSLIRRLKRHYKIDKKNHKKNFFTKHLWKLLNDSKRLHFKDYYHLNEFLKKFNPVVD